MSITNTLRQRFTEKGHTKYAGVKSVVTNMIAIHDALSAKRDEVRKDTNLSAQGQHAALRKVVEGHVATIGRGRRAVERGRDAIAKRRAELRPKSSIDKTNLVDALVHVALGEKLGGMSPIQRTAFLSDRNVDPRMIAAAAELPTAITGVTPEEFAKVEKTYIELHHAPIVAQIEDETDAWDLADQAVRAATGVLYEAGGFNSQHEFGKFVSAHDIVDSKREADESAKLAADTVFAQALALPLSARIKMGGELLDKNAADLIESDRAA